MALGGVVFGITRAVGGSGSGGHDAAATAPADTTTAITTAPTGTTTTPTVDPAATVRLAAVGDIVMGSPPYGLPSDGGASFFSTVDDLLTGDVVMGNLEGTLSTGGGSKCGSGSPNCFAFQTPPSYARWLKRAGFTTMNFANNHTDDFGDGGIRQTLDALRAAGLKWTGRPGQVTLQRVRGVRVATVGFTTYRWAPRMTNLAAAKALVEKAGARADIVIVVMHAGAEGSDRTHVRPGTETFLGENRGDSVAFTHAVVDAGADLVWGSGPHVMRGMEFYRGRLIAYSLGNFAGYKVFSLGGTLSTSGVLQATLRADGTFVSARLRPTQIVKPGLPAPGGGAIDLVRSLSVADFGARAARIDTNGRIRPPRN